MPRSRPSARPARPPVRRQPVQRWCETAAKDAPADRAPRWRSPETGRRRTSVWPGAVLGQLLRRGARCPDARMSSPLACL